MSGDKAKLAILDPAIACRLAALPVEPKDSGAVERLVRAGLLIDAGDASVTPARAAIQHDDLVKQ